MQKSRALQGNCRKKNVNKNRQRGDKTMLLLPRWAHEKGMTNTKTFHNHAFLLDAINCIQTISSKLISRLRKNKAEKKNSKINAPNAKAFIVHSLRRQHISSKSIQMTRFLFGIDFWSLRRLEQNPSVYFEH